MDRGGEYDTLNGIAEPLRRSHVLDVSFGAGHYSNILYIYTAAAA